LSERPSIAIGEMARRLGIPVHRLRRWADSGRVPSTVTSGGHRRFDPGAVSTALAGSDVRKRAATLMGVGPAWTATLAIAGLDEADVWRQASAALSLEAGSRAFQILQFAFTEMLNNAIDHSQGTRVEASLWERDDVAFEVSDDGLGAFETARGALGLDQPAEAALQFSTGKATSAPDRHTGQGIFFTSRALDFFELEANHLRFSVVAEPDDWALGSSRVGRGTRVVGLIARDTERQLTAVFERFTGDDLDFSKTRPVVKLAESGTAFMSRTEAKRLVARLAQFEEVELDFKGVETVGQGFVDEVFRVWAADHPGTLLVPVNMDPVVEFMVSRGRTNVRR
jgi:excisionase family DNA binding protein